MTDRERVISALRAAGVSTEDYGRFVNNTDYFRPSEFDVRAATPVLLEILPSLTEKHAARTVAIYLQNPTVGPEAFDVLRDAFLAWAPKDDLGTGWQLGIAVVRAARPDDVPVLLGLAERRELGQARQMLVASLWRFRKDASVAPALAELCRDPDVCLHAMSAYRRAVGNDTAIKLLSTLELDENPNVRGQATRARVKAAKAMRSIS